MFSYRLIPKKNFFLGPQKLFFEKKKVVRIRKVFFIPTRPNILRGCWLQVGKVREETFQCSFFLNTIARTLISHSHGAQFWGVPSVAPRRGIKKWALSVFHRQGYFFNLSCMFEWQVPHWLQILVLHLKKCWQDWQDTEVVWPSWCMSDGWLLNY